MHHLGATSRDLRLLVASPAIVPRLVTSSILCIIRLLLLPNFPHIYPVNFHNNCALFCCEDSLRYLVQDSLVSFTQMILDAAHSTLELPEDFQWQDNYIVSAFRCVLRQRLLVRAASAPSGACRVSAFWCVPRQRLLVRASPPLYSGHQASVISIGIATPNHCRAH